MKHLIRYKSSIERDYIYLLDYDLSVVCFEEQPLTIHYNIPGKSKVGIYTPDFLLTLRGSHYCLVECKSSNKVDDPINQAKFNAAIQYCAERNWEFAVVTDLAIRTNYRLENVKTLRRHALYDIPPQIKASVFSVLCESPMSLTIYQFQSLLPFPLYLTFRALMSMAFFHEIEIPVDHAPISISSSVFWPLTHIT